MHALGDAPSSYPLAWPGHLPRAPRRDADPFRVTLAHARDTLMHELRLAGVRDVVVSSNAALLRNGQIAANQGRIDDPGVAVYGLRRGVRVVFANDRYGNVAANVRAIAKTIDALRGIERWGTAETIDAAFAGFAALPVGGTSSSWWEVLGVQQNATKPEIDAAYRALVKTHHPDMGGDAERFREITAAYEAVKG